MATPKERLQDAAHRLAESAETLENLIDPGPHGPGRTPLNPSEEYDCSRDDLPKVIKAELKEVRKFADEIEEIVK